jgi:hypothetical protein
MLKTVYYVVTDVFLTSVGVLLQIENVSFLPLSYLHYVVPFAISLADSARKIPVFHLFAAMHFASQLL